jgi:hypothetical protein
MFACEQNSLVSEYVYTSVRVYIYARIMAGIDVHVYMPAHPPCLVGIVCMPVYMYVSYCVGVVYTYSKSFGGFLHLGSKVLMFCAFLYTTMGLYGYISLRTSLSISCGCMFNSLSRPCVYGHLVIVKIHPLAF